VADATHDLSDDAFHEIHLSGKQLVFLFMATTVVSVVIFLLGVFVGRGVPAARQSQDQLTDPAATLATASAPAPAPVADTGPPAAEPPAPPAETEALSYKKRLEGDTKTAESLKPAPSQSSSAVARASAPTSAAPAAQQVVVGVAQPGTWVVQVHVLRDRTVATGIVQRLIAKDYPAYLVAAGPPTSTYKVQVGRFKDREVAQKAVERLKEEEQFNSWITR
jgi:cell division septation protein DedD